MEPQLPFGQHLLLAVIDTAVLGALVLVVGFILNLMLERHKSDLEWRKAISAARTQAYRELWSLTRTIGGTESGIPLTADQRRAFSTALSEWYWSRGNGLFVSHATSTQLFKGWALLGNAEASDKDIRQHYSQVRTDLKVESGVYSKEEAVRSVTQ